MTVVIVGGGHAGGQAAASLRQEGYEGDVIVVADEPHIPYQRPPLSKQYLAGEYGLERVYLRPEKFYEDKEIVVRKGVRVLQIDPNARMLECDNGETLAYDKLLLATGSRPRKLVTAGDDLAGVHYLRTIADVDAIRRDFQPGRSIAIVGGGYIGLEVAAVAVEMGLAVTVLEMEERILGRVTTPEMSAFYHDLHTAKGVVIRTGLRAESFTGAGGRLKRVVCASGDIVDADLAVVGIGIVPNVELAAAAGLDCDNGIVVDETTRTTGPQHPCHRRLHQPPESGARAPPAPGVRSQRHGAVACRRRESRRRRQGLRLGALVLVGPVRPEAADGWVLGGRR